MAELDFVKLGEVEALDSVPDGANALVEVEGEIKRVPGAGLGGGIKTAILRLTIVNGDDATTYTATCENMTFGKAKATMLAGEPLAVLIGLDLGAEFGSDESMPSWFYANGIAWLADSQELYIDCAISGMAVGLSWTADDITGEETNSGARAE